MVLRDLRTDNEKGRTCSHDTDDEDYAEPMRWIDSRVAIIHGHEKSGMKANNCWACERVYFNDYRPFDGPNANRKKPQNKLGRSLPDREEFLKKRARFLRRRRKGLQRWKPKLIMPEDDFWLLPRYIKKFGDPNSKENKKKGHRVCRKHGYKGVVVPGDDGEGPWKCQQSLNNALESHETLAEDCSDVSEDLIETIFECLKDEREEQHASVAQGMVAALLAQHATQEDAMPDVPKKQKKKRLNKKKCISSKATRAGDESDTSDPRTKKRTLTQRDSNASTWSDDPVMSRRARKRKAVGGGGGKAAGGGIAVGASSAKVSTPKKATAGGRALKGVSVPALGPALEDFHSLTKIARLLDS